MGSGIFARAAAGDLDSQIAMGRRAFTMSQVAAGAPALNAVEALHWMRMAEANGGRDLWEVRQSIPGLLLIIANLANGEGAPDTAVPFQAEALVRLRRLAGEGDELAQAVFDDVVAGSDAKILDLALDMEGALAS